MRELLGAGLMAALVAACGVTTSAQGPSESAGGTDVDTSAQGEVSGSASASTDESGETGETGIEPVLGTWIGEDISTFEEASFAICGGETALFGTGSPAAAPMCGRPFVEVTGELSWCSNCGPLGAGAWSIRADSVLGCSSCDGSDCVQCPGLLCPLNPAPCDPASIGDCSAGQKCTAAACADALAEFPDTNLCVDVVGTRALGEPCTTLQHRLDGQDDCAEGLYCHDADPVTGDGVCVAFCSSPSLSCPIGLSCQGLANGVLPLCLEP